MKIARKYIISFVGMYCVSCISALLTLVYLNIESKGYFTKWAQLESPPEQLKTLIAPGYAETISGKLLRYESNQYELIYCKTSCWEFITKDSIPSNSPLPISSCGWYPRLDKYSSFLAVCEDWNWRGIYKAVWAIDEVGNLWLWQEASTDPLVFALGPLVVFLLVLALFGIIITIMTVWDGLSLITRADKKSSEENQVNANTNKNTQLFEITTKLFLFVFSLVFLILVINYTLDKEYPSYSIFFFCLNPLSISIAVFGIAQKNKTYIIIGLLNILIMSYGWISYLIQLFTS